MANWGVKWMVGKWDELVGFSVSRLGFPSGYWELPDIKVGWLEGGRRFPTLQWKWSCRDKSWHKSVEVEFQVGAELPRVPVLRAGTYVAMGVALFWDEQGSPSARSEQWQRRHRRSLGDRRGDGERAVDMIDRSWSLGLGTLTFPSPSF